MPLITLIGYRGSGKSAVAAALAAILGCRWSDADEVLERELGTTIATLLSERGEPFFRDREAELLVRLLATERGVLATGGGVVLRADNRERLMMEGRPVVWLQASADRIRERLAADPATADRRPALGGGDALDEVAAAVEAREPLYRAVADAVIDVTDDPPGRVAERVATWLVARRTPPLASPPEPIP